MRIEDFIRCMAPVVAVTGVVFFTMVSWQEDPAYTDLAISGIYMLGSFLLMIVSLLMDLNLHFKKLEEKEDSDVQE